MSKPNYFLRKLRAERGLSQGKVAESVGMAKTTIFELESGKKKRPYDSTVLKLSEFYGVPFEDILKSFS